MNKYLEVVDVKSKILFIILVLFLSCKKPVISDDINGIQESNRRRIVNKVNKVFIIGKTDEENSFRYFNLINSSYFDPKTNQDGKLLVFSDSLNYILDSIYKPKLMHLWVFGNKSYRGRLYIKPGDTITFKIEKERLLFTGESSVENNFYTQLFNQNLDFGKAQYKDDIYEYKSQIKDIYDKKLKFLKDYKTQNKSISENFIEAAKADLKFEYLSCLIQPRYIFSKGTGLYLIGGNGVFNAVQNREKRDERLFVLEKYLDNITIEDFKKPEFLDNYFFKEAINDFIRYYFVSSKYIDFSQEKFFTEKEFIQKNFKGDIEYFAIARMIYEYNLRGFGYSTENIKILKNTMKEYDSVFSTKPSYKEKMAEIKQSLDNFKFGLPDDALNLTKLVNPVGDTVTLQEVFNESHQKIKVIDFWASWCPPCIREIKKAKQFKNKLSNQDNVEWVYLSIDKDKDKWLKKTNELQEYLNTKHQYIVAGGKNSSLSKALKVSGIPRYVIFDKQEQIVLDNAPRPSDSIIFKKVIDKINKEK